jgi:hypothetical protein
MSTLGVETHTLTIRERVLNAITKALAVGFKLVKAAVVTIAFNFIITAITKIVNGQTDFCEKIKQTAYKAKQSYLQSSFTNSHPPHNIKKRKIAGEKAP